MENFIKVRGGLARSTKKFNRKNLPLLWKMGGGLTQSIKSLTEKIKENRLFRLREASILLDLKRTSAGGKKCGGLICQAADSAHKYCCQSTQHDTLHARKSILLRKERALSICLKSSTIFTLFKHGAW